MIKAPACRTQLTNHIKNCFVSCNDNWRENEHNPKPELVRECIQILCGKISIIKIRECASCTRANIHNSVLFFSKFFLPFPDFFSLAVSSLRPSRCIKAKIPPKMRLISTNKKKDEKKRILSNTYSEIIRTGVRSFGSSLLSNKSCAWFSLCMFKRIVQAKEMQHKKTHWPKEIKRKIIIIQHICQVESVLNEIG